MRKWEGTVPWGAIPKSDLFAGLAQWRGSQMSESLVISATAKSCMLQKEQVRTLSISCTVVPVILFELFSQDKCTLPQHHGVHGSPGLRAHTARGMGCSQPECFSFSPCLWLMCLTFKPCLLTLQVKTGFYFSFLECAGLVQVVKWSKLSSFHNINTVLANNNYSTLGVFPLICWCMWGWWWC